MEAKSFYSVEYRYNTIKVNIISYLIITVLFNCDKDFLIPLDYHTRAVNVDAAIEPKNARRIR